jgi:hypothetical protein
MQKIILALKTELMRMKIIHDNINLTEEQIHQRTKKANKKLN